ncbi:metal-dependent hydrolase [Flagellimonas pacifica]|uniref:L-ascorbate metabolism protein UlaG, beta-lactamase superfamily n=1 Tax=Flagellimonas pacifica TaxID=1247520 RepID=A0A285MWW0_9FLAO|nr:metal-dependent hydrolase [Allomuricauda parva]SNZ00306.1 L-ascorbate metabolism protein UlaG, beta-lactamase superfamily [Allomuricauda parva]
MNITFLGHATIFIETENYKLIIDPFISGNNLATHINIDTLKVDYILITHGHQDHVLDVETIAENNPNAILISNYEIVQWFSEKGIKGHALNHGGNYHFDFGSLKYVNAIHSSILPDGSYGGNPGGFILKTPSKCIYIAGDTALTLDMKLIPMTCSVLDLAVLPIGDNFTMGYEDASIASDFIECNKVLGYHYDTFPPIKLDKTAAQSHFKSKGKELILLDVGSNISI